MKDGFRDGWFVEVGAMDVAHGFGIKVERVLHEERSPWQHIMVLESTDYGRVLVLDNTFQLTERDEVGYHEMLTHVPLLTHSNPQDVLVIGGGDGGIVREVVKHGGVKRVVLCELDAAVTEVCRRLMPSLASGLDDPRVQVVHGDGAAYLREQPPSSWDVIIVDSPDPVGAAAALYTPEFYASVKRGLRPTGVFAGQGQSLFLHLDLAQKLMSTARELWKYPAYCLTHVPTYPAGHIGLLVASDGADPRRGPSRDAPDALLDQLRYYRPELHQAAFVLPMYAERALR